MREITDDDYNRAAELADNDLIQDLMLGMHTHDELLEIVGDFDVSWLTLWRDALGTSGINDFLISRVSELAFVVRAQKTVEKKGMARGLAYSVLRSYRHTEKFGPRNHPYAFLLFIGGVDLSTIERWADYDLRSAVILYASGYSTDIIALSIRHNLDASLIDSLTVGA